MHVVSFCASKGGVGKSTLSISLGIAAQEAGERVYLIDADPQESIISWAGRRKAEAPAVDRSHPGQIVRAIPGLKDAGFSLVIIDTQGSDTGGAAEAMRLSDLVLVPVRPFAIDVLAINATRDAIDRLGKPFCVILNGVQPRESARLTDAAEVFNGRVAPSIVNRFAHPDAIAHGLGVTEFEPEGRAAAEVRELWAFVKGRLH